MKRADFFKKRVVLIALILILTAGWAQAFLFEITPLSKEAIVKLEDDHLIETYINAMIELEAVSTFYDNAGFTPRDYGKFKALLRFRTDLLMEIQRRELQIPQIR